MHLFESQSAKPLAKLGAAAALGALSYMLLNRRSERVASIRDSIEIGLGVLLPSIAMGPIIRRPAMVKIAETFDLMDHGVKVMQRMREKYGAGPIMLRVPIRNQAVILEPNQVRRVLDETPEIFSTASSEKVAALRHFEPKSALISDGAERQARRDLNEDVLQHKNAVHTMSEGFVQIVEEEMSKLFNQIKSDQELSWPDFYKAWFCIVRRVVFGDSARDDRRIIDLMEKLRSDGNLAFMKPVRKDLRNELHQSIMDYIRKAEPGSLAEVMNKRSQSKIEAPEQQIPQWLFAFDPAGMATFRTLALLSTHPEALERVKEEARGGAAATLHRPFTRACVLESLRLWPTTPLVLRQTTRETEWDNGLMPKNTGVLIFAPYFHRDDSHIPFAHEFNPDVWIADDQGVKGNMPRLWPFVPFSGGTGVCPGRNLVLTLTSAAIAAVIEKYQISLENSKKLRTEHLPGTLSHFSLKFKLEPLQGQEKKVSSL